MKKTRQRYNMDNNQQKPPTQDHQSMMEKFNLLILIVFSVYSICLTKTEYCHK